jgi:hypothetical protein
MVWLSVGGEIPSCAAALVKFRCSATATKALSSANRVPRIPSPRYAEQSVRPLNSPQILSAIQFIIPQVVLFIIPQVVLFTNPARQWARFPPPTVSPQLQIALHELLGPGT